jgi:hypothetical protein
MAADTSYPNSFQVRQDGNAVVPTGKSLDIESGGALKVAGTDITTFLAAINTGAPVVVSFNYTSALVTQGVFTADRAYTVASIVGRPRVAGSGGACTIAFFKAPSGTAIGSGTALNTGSYNLVGTADTNQTLSLSSTAADLAIASGDSIGYVLTGTATSAVGSVTIKLTPA